MVREITFKVVTDGCYCGDENEMCPLLKEHRGYKICTMGNLLDESSGVAIGRDSRVGKYVRMYSCFDRFNELELFHKMMKE